MNQCFLPLMCQPLMCKPFLLSLKSKISFWSKIKNIYISEQQRGKYDHVPYLTYLSNRHAEVLKRQNEASKL